MEISLTPEAFVSELEQANAQVLSRLEPTEALTAETSGSLDVKALLRIALKNELEATDLAARWMTTTTDVEVRLAFARQVGDESRHYRLLQERLASLGVDTRSFDPLAGAAYSPLTQHLMGLTDMVERVAAGPFTREAIAVVKNRQFIDLCRHQGDLDTARLYEEIIQPDEGFHQQLGRHLLLRLATTPETQERATRAAVRTLELAEELQTLAFKKAGIHHAPGC